MWNNHHKKTMRSVVLMGGVKITWYYAGGIAAANCIIAYQPKGAADYAASKVNLANPGTYNATDGAAFPTWDAVNGWIFNGSTQYLTTGYIPAAGQTKSLIARLSDAVTSNFPLIGTQANANKFGVMANSAWQGGRTYGNGSPTVTVLGQLTGGVFAVAGNQGYLNGVPEGGVITAHAGVLIAIRVGHDFSSGADGWYQGYLQALAVYDITLSAEQVLAVYAKMAAL